LGDLSQFGERFFVANSQIRQDFTVDFDGGLFQAIHKTAVGQSKLACGSIDSHDPKGTELTLSLSTIPISILAGFDHGLFGHAINSATGAVITFRLLENLLVPGSRSDASFYSRHG